MAARERNEIELALSSMPLFAMLAPAEVREIARDCRIERLSAGESIVGPEDEADRFFVILRGRVKVYQLSSRGDEQILHLYGPGATVGEAAMWSGGRYPAHAEAAADAELLIVRREALRRLLSRRPEIAFAMLAGLSRKLQEFTRLIERLSLKEVPARLAQVLLEISRERGSRSFVLSQTKRELAAQIGTVSETLSRALARLKSDGLISVSGRRITILEPEKLARVADA